MKRKKSAPKPRLARTARSPKVNIIGPIYGCFNMASDLAEIRRLVEGIGAEIDHGLPDGQRPRRREAPGRCRRQRLLVPRVRPAAVRAAGKALSSGADRPAQHHAVPAHARRELLGLDPEPFIEQREAHHDQAACGICGARSPRTSSGRRASASSRAKPTYPRPAATSWRTSSGFPCSFAIPRKAGVKPDNEAVQQAIDADTPMLMFGSLQRAHVPGRAQGELDLTSRPPSPGAIIRRHTGTPFMGYSGATYLVQEICNALFDALFHVLPLAGELDDVDRRRRLEQPAAEELSWTDGALEVLDQRLAQDPILTRISTAKRIRDAVERMARSRGDDVVTREHVEHAAADSRAWLESLTESEGFGPRRTRPWQRVRKPFRTPSGSEPPRSARFAARPTVAEPATVAPNASAICSAWSCSAHSC